MALTSKQMSFELNCNICPNRFCKRAELEECYNRTYGGKDSFDFLDVSCVGSFVDDEIAEVLDEN